MRGQKNRSGGVSGIPTPTGPTKTSKTKTTLCADCSADLDNCKIKSINCDVCDTWFCMKCSKVKGNVFDAISEDPNILWTCIHCNIALPGLKKVLSKLTSFEERFDKLERQIESLQSKGPEPYVNRDVNNNLGGNVHQAVHEVLTEEREIERRRLNILVHGLPESSGDSEAERSEDDESKVEEIVNDKLSCGVTVESYERIGQTYEGRKKPRPIRLVVKTFDDKRKILDSSKKLKNNKELSNVYIAPDLTKRQREQAYHLRQEKRRREEAGETGWVIRRGKLVRASNQENRSDHSYSGGVGGPAAARGAGGGTSFQA